MTSAEILFEAYDLLPVPDEKEFLRLVMQRVNLDDIWSAIEDTEYRYDSDRIEGFLSLFLTGGDVKEFRELEAIRDIRQQRKRKKRQEKERAERIRANAAKVKVSEDPNNPYRSENRAWIGEASLNDPKHFIVRRKNCSEYLTYKNGKAKRYRSLVAACYKASVLNESEGIKI